MLQTALSFLRLPIAHFSRSAARSRPPRSLPSGLVQRFGCASLLQQKRAVVFRRSAAQFSNPVMDASYKGSPVAVIGAGVAGCVAASSLVERGIPVTLFEKGRGPGGRISTRREMAKDGSELLFDHGAQYMTVSHPSVQNLVDKWQSAGLLELWHGKVGSYDFGKQEFSEETYDDGQLKYVGVPGMNSFCKAMAAQSGIQARYDTAVTQLIWKEEGSWHLKSQGGENLGTYGAVVVADKALAKSQPGFTSPLEHGGVPDLYEKMAGIKSVPCFAVMLAFPHHLTSVPYDTFIVKYSDLLGGAFRVSSKPGRTVLLNSEYWVLQSTICFAEKIIEKEGLTKPSNELLESIAETLLKQFQEIAPEATNPFHMKAHRWGFAFPMDAAAPEAKCLVDTCKRVVACGDFCVSPQISGAILSGLAAADNIHQILKVADAKF